MMMPYDSKQFRNTKVLEEAVEILFTKNVITKDERDKINQGKKPPKDI